MRDKRIKIWNSPDLSPADRLKAGESLLERLDGVIADTVQLGKDAARDADIETGWFADATLRNLRARRELHVAQLAVLRATISPVPQEAK